MTIQTQEHKAFVIKTLKAACQGIHMSDSQASCQEPKDEERLGTGLVLDVVLDGIRDEVLDLEEYLQESDFPEAIRGHLSADLYSCTYLILGCECASNRIRSFNIMSN